MKKLVAVFLALTLMLLVCATLAEDSPYYVRTDNGKTLNLREEPSKNSKVLLKIPYGDEFWVFEMRSDGWAYGHWGGQFGYVMSRYLSSTIPAPYVPSAEEKAKEKEAEEMKIEQEKLNKELKSEKEVEPFTILARPSRPSGWVNMRLQPSKIASRIRTLPDGYELTVVGETDKWYRVKDHETGKIGYVFKQYTVVQAKPKTVASETGSGAQRLGKLTVNGEFDLTCRLPEGYKLSVVNIKGDKIVASVTSEDVLKPQMYLSIAYDETYGEVERINDMSDDDLRVLESSFNEMNQVEISYAETGHGTKLLIAREIGGDTDFVDILAIYKGYFIEFNMTPNAQAANQVLTDEQIKMCIDFLTDVDFIPVK